MSTLTIGDRSRDGMLEIVDTQWDHNGTLRVTVREMLGRGPAGGTPAADLPIRVMRDLAKRALEHPEHTRSARLVRTFFADGQGFATFAVSRLER